MAVVQGMHPEVFTASLSGIASLDACVGEELAEGPNRPEEDQLQALVREVEKKIGMPGSGNGRAQIERLLLVWPMENSLIGERSLLVRQPSCGLCVEMHGRHSHSLRGNFERNEIEQQVQHVGEIAAVPCHEDGDTTAVEANAARIFAGRQRDAHVPLGSQLTQVLWGLFFGRALREE